jgi:hypothetical protein
MPVRRSIRLQVIDPDFLSAVHGRQNSLSALPTLGDHDAR